MQAGDYLLSHIFQELMAVYKVCVWTPGTMTTTGENKPGTTQFAGGSNFAAAKAAAEANFTATSTSTLFLFPRAVSILSIDGSGTVGAQLLRTHANYAVSPPAFVSRTVEFYAAGDWQISGVSQANTEYDDNGDAPVSIPQGTYVLFDSQGPSTTGTITSVELGQAWPFPNWPAVNPSFPGSSTSRARGWRVPSGGVFSIVKWDVVGGFSYP
jgi:hypothetical protein